MPPPPRPLDRTATAQSPNAPLRILFLATDLDSFLSHKRPVAEAAAAAGYDVTVAGAWPRGSRLIDNLGFKMIDIGWRRAPSMLGAVARAAPDIVRVRRLVRGLRPDILHNIDLKPSVIGSLAAAGLAIKIVNSINGLGYAFVAPSPMAKAIRWTCGVILRTACHRHDALTVVQNRDDAALLSQELAIPGDSIRIIRGSGVDPADYEAAPIPAGPPNFLILSRLLRIKGIHVAVEALRRVRARGIAATLTIAGAPDTGNPSSVDAATLAEWSGVEGVNLLGHIADVRPLIARSLAVIQPSLGGEGLPKSLLEAAAGGRALIGTDVPGTREIVIDGETGRLVPPDDPDALAGAMIAAAVAPDSCRTWGLAAREKVAKEFATDLICRQHLAIYRGIVALDSRA